ncbi:hypothetical protein L4Z54_006062 [Pseudomonas aeruginosa]|nr:hypothetical protein [Pseudomonas aeruginosa]
MNDAAYAEARWAELQNQGDLAWDLDAITNRSEAIACSAARNLARICAINDAP